MSKFADKTGQEWAVEITHGHLKALKRDCGIDLRDALKTDAENNTVAEAIGDSDKFGQLLWILCGEQARAAGIDPEAFAYRFDGNATRAAVAAIWEAVWDFFQGSKPAKKAAEAFAKAAAQTTSKLETAWEKAGNSLASGSSDGTSGASAGSTPAP